MTNRQKNKENAANTKTSQVLFTLREGFLVVSQNKKSGQIKTNEGLRRKAWADHESGSKPCVLLVYYSG